MTGGSWLPRPWHASAQPPPTAAASLLRNDDDDADKQLAMDFDEALPSSPPPSSPPCAGTDDLAPSPFFERHPTAFTTKSSSPPPVFSSDDSCESVDVANYESPRIHKNKRKGAWWDTHASAHASPQVKKTKFARNLDSGIYMLSDATSSCDDLPLPPYMPPASLRAAVSLPRSLHARAADDEAMDVDVDVARHAAPAAVFNRHIDDGLAADRESYDLVGLDLADRDITRIGELNSVISHPPVYDNELPTAGQYRSLLPRLHVNLGKNKLRRLVPALFHLDDLTGLYLRQNDIDELPQQISRLRKLEALDVSLNKLHYLPFDIVTLLAPHGNMTRLTLMGTDLLQPMSFRRFSLTDYQKQHQGPLHHLDDVREDANKQLAHLYPTLATCQDRDQAVWRIRYFESWANSFGGADDARECAAEDVGFYSHHPSLRLEALVEGDAVAHAPRYIARTLVSYYGQDGKLLKGSPKLPTSDQEHYPVIIETNQGTYGLPSSPWFVPPCTSKVSSLFTTTLHMALHSLEPHKIRDYLSPCALPMVEAILSRAEANAADGYGLFRECHVCRKHYVVARAEWVEFWSRGSGDFLPLRVSVCSWGCVPPDMVKRPQKELTW